MLGIIGLILMAGGAGGAWWAFQKAAGEGAVHWGQPVFIIVGVIGLVLAIVSVWQWWISD